MSKKTRANRKQAVFSFESRLVEVWAMVARWPSGPTHSRKLFWVIHSTLCCKWVGTQLKELREEGVSEYINLKEQQHRVKSRADINRRHVHIILVAAGSMCCIHSG